jgi:filamentous hemagglutinin family protein
VSKTLSSWFGLSLCILGYLCAINNPASAQIASDDTVNTQVTENGNTAEITGGETRGDNLFHSFQDFSVETGNEAAFLNANDIANIFSRVTGGNVSNIDGLISANGSANLFLINPAGIIFGEGARLDLGGSFYGSSASSILFEDGEFSATDLDNPPLLTVNAPIGLGFRDRPGDITVQGDGQGTREKTDDLIDTENALRVDSDKTFALVGGKINLEGATIKTPGGRIELGSLQGNQQISLTPVNRGFGLDYAGVQNFQDIQLSKTATIDASGLVAGDIQVQGKNISLTEGSQIEASTLGDSLSQDLPGTIKINAIDTIKIDGQDSSNSGYSAIVNQVYPDAVGDVGKVTISTTNLALTNGGSIVASTFGKGDGGNVLVNAGESITLDGSGSVIESAVAKDVEGNGGELSITTANLSLTKGGQVYASTFGKGDAGSIEINATESITLDGDNTSIESEVGLSGAEGNGGNLNITTVNLSLTNFSKITGDSKGQGDTAKLNINTANLSLTSGSEISADTWGSGDGSSIDINASESITLNIVSSITSGVTTFVDDSNVSGGDVNITTPNLSLNYGSEISVGTGGEGDSGKLSINTSNLSLTKRSLINSDTSGGLELEDTSIEGDGGLLDINATESINLNESYITSGVTGATEGNGGELNITTPNLSLTNGSRISTSTYGYDDESIAQGNGGNITIDVADTLNVNNSGPQDTVIYPGIKPDYQVTGIFAGNEGYSIGSAGNIDITASKLSLINGAAISAFSEGQGNAGLIDIKANILSLDNGDITAQALNEVNGGNLAIDANFIVAYPNSNSDIFASAEEGEGGNINIDAESVLGIKERPLNDFTNDINASSEFDLDGSVNINTSDINPVQGAAELPSNVVEAKQTAEQTCSANRQGKANNGLAIAGKGGVPPAPDAPLNSENIISGEQSTAAFAIPQPIETSQGQIQPARGIMVTESGKIVLTAYRTNNAGERVPEIKPNCN